MFTNNIDELNELGFIITRTNDVQTVVEHTKSFIIKGSETEITAPFNDTTNKYTVTLSGYPVSNELQESIRQPVNRIRTAVGRTPICCNIEDRLISYKLRVQHYSIGGQPGMR